jgi:small nuclear ribonucleoprotein (snRNP)-like protein
MFNINRYLNEWLGKDVVIKLKIGKIKCIIESVGNDGSLVVSKITVIETRDTSLKNWEQKERVLIRKDSIVAVSLI